MLIETPSSTPEDTAVTSYHRVVRHPLTRFVLRRLGALVVVLVGLALATFGMLRLIPGDPAVIIAGEGATTQQIEQIRAQLDLNLPLLDQLRIYIVDLAHGNLGKSYLSQQPVTQLIYQRVGLSLELAALGLAFVLLVSIPLGIVLGAFTRERRHPRTEVAFTGVTSVLGSTPQFVLATILAYIFALLLRWLPVAGYNGFESLILPALAVGIPPTAMLTRIVRIETLNVLASDFIRTARGKRLPTWEIYARHTLPNVVTAALTYGGLVFAGLIAGAVVVENVFALPGLGTALVQGVLNHDYPVVQGIVLVLGFAIVVLNAIVDLILAVIDPRTAAGAA